MKKLNQLHQRSEEPYTSYQDLYSKWANKEDEPDRTKGLDEIHQLKVYQEGDKYIGPIDSTTKRVDIEVEPNLDGVEDAHGEAIYKGDEVHIIGDISYASTHTKRRKSKQTKKDLAIVFYTHLVNNLYYTPEESKATTQQVFSQDITTEEFANLMNQKYGLDWSVEQNNQDPSVYDLIYATEDRKSIKDKYEEKVHPGIVKEWAVAKDPEFNLITQDLKDLRQELFNDWRASHPYSIQEEQQAQEKILNEEELSPEEQQAYNTYLEDKKKYEVEVIKPELLTYKQEWENLMEEEDEFVPWAIVQLIDPQTGELKNEFKRVVHYNIIKAFLDESKDNLRKRVASAINNIILRKEASLLNLYIKMSAQS